MKFYLSVALIGLLTFASLGFAGILILIFVLFISNTFPNVFKPKGPPREHEAEDDYFYVDEEFYDNPEDD